MKASHVYYGHRRKLKTVVDGKAVLDDCEAIKINEFVIYKCYSVDGSSQSRLSQRRVYLADCTFPVHASISSTP